MPTFPTYNGELPACLNPRNPRHYLLLIYWIYFRSRALKCYPYQADPEFYRAGWGLGIFRTWGVPAYRNLYLMVTPTILLLSVLVGLPIVLIASSIQGIPIEWLEWFVGIALGVTIGMAIGMMIAMAVGILGVAGGVAGSVVGSIAGGVAFGTAFSVIFGISVDMAGEIIFGLVGGIAINVAIGIGGGMTIGAVGGIVVGMMIAVAGGILAGAVAPLAFSIGWGRAPFYPFQLILALHGTNQRVRHPLAWDEMVVLPLLRTQQLLISQLEEDENEGLGLAANVARNPFQRGAAQSALQSFLHCQSTPLHFLYIMLTEPTLNEYVFAPITKEDWQLLSPTKELLLGELAGRWVDYSNNFTNRLFERLVWNLTWYFRDRRQTPLTNFAGMLYELLDSEATIAKEFDLSSYREVYTSLGEYPGGVEIAGSFEVLASCLAYDSLLALPAAMAFVSEFAPHEGAIRPTVLAALVRLGQVGAEVAAYRDATSRVRQQGALLRATDMLDELDEYVVAQVMAPEEAILRRIIRQWRRLVSEEGGVVGRVEELAPVANPYVVGNPVTGTLFVGREDIMRRLEELWAAEGQRPSVVIYGHRRMGKSSILHNLGARFGGGTTVVDFNMQRVGYVADTGELLVALAFALYDSLPLAQQEKLGEPDEERFLERNPYTTFDRFLKQLERVREGQRFIITIDEFELLEEAISEGRLEARLIDFWRGIIQSYAWFVMAFAGLHTLQEMTHSYWHPLFGSVTTIPVTFLRPAAARKLITQPTLDFSLDYDHDAIERIISLTNGQPYLIQLICHGLVTRFNRQTFEQAIKRQPRFTLTDVEAIINAPDFFRDGNAYFTGVWRQAETGSIAGQPTILKALALSESPLTLDIIAQEARLPYHETKITLAELQAHGKRSLPPLFQKIKSPTFMEKWSFWAYQLIN